MALTLALVALGITLNPARADPAPESLRIQQEVEKEYQQNPAVSINRPNAHHRIIKAPDDATGPQGNGVVSPDQPLKAPEDKETH